MDGRSHVCPAPHLLLGLLFVLCTALNLTKAVHIDDTAYLEIAQALLRDPLHAMSAEVNWDVAAAPIANINQPHLFPALLALTMRIFGPSELALHGLMAVFTGLAIVFFHLLARRLAAGHAVLLTAVFCLGPAFLPAQNLMTDVPVVALWLVVFWAILTADDRQAGRRCLLGAVALGLANLVKYPSLVLLPVVALAMIVRRQARMLWVLLIPLLMLAGWSWLNYLDYGGLHLLARVERGASGLSVGPILIRALEWVVTLGAVAPFSLGFVATRAWSRWHRTGVAVASLLAGGLLAALMRPSAGDTSLVPFWAIFLANGALTLGLVALALRAQILTRGGPDDPRAVQDSVVLLLWLAGAAAFVIAFSPFMAARHVLLALPAVLLLLGRHASRLGIPPNDRCLLILGLGLNTALGLVVAVSDYDYANVYREYAARIRAELPAEARIWHAGHWGWQWYADRAGMLQYDAQRSSLGRNDYLVIALGTCPQIIPGSNQQDFRLVRQIDVPAGPTTWLRTMADRPFGGLYATLLATQGPPWRLSTGPLDTFLIYRVVGVEN